MRPDMAKVVTEKPRSGSGYNNNCKNDVTATRLKLRGARLAQAVDEDYDEAVDPEDGYVSKVMPWSPAQRGAYTENHVQRTPYDTKSLSDVLGPLRGYLRKQVGRPWDDVFSELSHTLDRRSTSGSHIWDHVMSEVQTNCWMGVDGVIYGRAPYRRTYAVDGLYVHPFTGVLCSAPEFSYKQRHRGAMTAYALARKLTELGLWKATPRVIGLSLKGRPIYASDTETPNMAAWKIIDDLHVCERRNGVWLVHEFMVLDPDEVIGVTIIGDREIPKRRKDDKDAKRIRKVSVRQVGKREKTLWAALTSQGNET